jgi:WD40 repeat protein
LWDASTGVALQQLNGHTNWVRSVTFSHDGLHIVSGADDNSVQVWNASTGAALQQIKGHTDWVRSVAFSYDGTQIVYGSDDNSVRVWDAAFTDAELQQSNGKISLAQMSFPAGYGTECFMVFFGLLQ